MARRIYKKEAACEECTNKCTIIHPKNKNPSSITSFFKVIIDKRFLDFLYLPPKFVHTAPELVGEKIDLLEYSSGRKLCVKISKVDGSLAFEQGWNAFSVQYGLNVGYFLVFHYIKGSHFVVQIYDSSGCVKPDLSEEKRNGNKRSRICKESVSNSRPVLAIDDNTMNKQDSNTSVDADSDIEIVEIKDNDNAVKEIPMHIMKSANCQNSNRRPPSMFRAETLEERLLEIGRDPAIEHEEHRNCILDLSCFEMQRDTFSAAESKAGILRNEISHCHANMVVNFSVVDQEQLIQDPTYRAKSLEVSNLEVIEKHYDSVVTDIVFSTPNQHLFNGKAPELLFKKEVTLGDNGKCNTTMSDEVTRQFPFACFMTNTYSGNKPVVMNEAKGLSANPTYKVVKTEIKDEIPTLSPITAKLSCLLPKDNQSFLELPSRLPSSPFSGGFKLERKLVYLRDPLLRLWPVLYHEKENLQVLTTGWGAFCKSNRIRSGDKCIFGVESEPDGIYVVTVVRR